MQNDTHKKAQSNSHAETVAESLRCYGVALDRSYEQAFTLASEGVAMNIDKWIDSAAKANPGIAQRAAIEAAIIKFLFSRLRSKADRA